jgi:hypothetical protein
MLKFKFIEKKGTSWRKAKREFRDTTPECDVLISARKGTDFYVFKYITAPTKNDIRHDFLSSLMDRYRDKVTE